MSAARFSPWSRWLHWSMALLIIAMVLIGVGMAASVSQRHALLLSIHRPLGIAILILAVARLINRWISPPPPLPTSVPTVQRWAALGSHYVLYVLMFALPVVGWAMLSAAPYPIVLVGSVHLPPLLSPDPVVYAILRRLHTLLGFALYAVIVAHFSAALLHALIRRDGVFESMAGGRVASDGDSARH